MSWRIAVPAPGEPTRGERCAHGYCRHIRNAMMNAHKYMRIRATLWGAA